MTDIQKEQVRTLRSNGESGHTRFRHHDNPHNNYTLRFIDNKNMIIVLIVSLSCDIILIE